MKRWFSILSMAGLIWWQVIAPPMATSAPLERTWSTTYRNDIKVYLCIQRFRDVFGSSLDEDRLRAAVKNSKELPYYSNATPGLACNSLVECLFAWTDHTGGDGTNDYKIIYKQGYVNSNNEFVLYGNTAWFTAGGSTRLAPDLGTGGNFWLLGWRGNDNNTWGNAMSMGVGSFPNWSDQTFPDSLLQVSPTLEYGDSWSEFTYYYIRR